MAQPDDSNADGRRIAAHFTERLRTILGDDLVSAVLYGSAARGGYRPGASDVNLLLILRAIGPDQLRRASPAVREWVAAGNPPPLMMTQAEWRGSADAFPIEYSDIRESREVLLGPDPAAHISIEPEHLRLQLENELRGKKIQLREGYLIGADAPHELGSLLIQSLSTFLTLFRAILRLAGRPVPTDPRAVIEETGTLVGFRPEPVFRVLDRRTAGGAFETHVDGEIAPGYLEAIERTVEWLDRFEPTRTTGGA